MNFATTVRSFCSDYDRLIVSDRSTIQIDHCKRHDDMEIAVLSVAERKIYLGRREIEYGLCDYLLGITRSKSALRKRNMRIYGCRHCLSYSAVLSTDNLDSNEPAASEEAVAKTVMRQQEVKLMSFDGLRSHLKAWCVKCVL